MQVLGRKESYSSEQSIVRFLEMVPSATSEMWDRKIVFIKRIYTEGTVFMKPAVVDPSPTLDRQ